MEGTQEGRIGLERESVLLIHGFLGISPENGQFDVVAVKSDCGFGMDLTTGTKHSRTRMPKFPYSTIP